MCWFLRSSVRSFLGSFVHWFVRSLAAVVGCGCWLRLLAPAAVGPEVEAENPRCVPASVVRCVLDFSVRHISTVPDAATVQHVQYARSRPACPCTHLLLQLATPLVSLSVSARCPQLCLMLGSK